MAKSVKIGFTAIVLKRLFVLGLFFVGAAASASTYTFDWEKEGWTAGALSGNYSNVQGSGVDIDISVTGDTAYLAKGPSSPQVDDGFGQVGHKAFHTDVDFKDKSQSITVTIHFSRPVVLSGLTWRDIDSQRGTPVKNNFDDKIIVVAKRASGATVSLDNVQKGASVEELSANAYESDDTGLLKPSNEEGVVILDINTSVTDLVYTYTNGDTGPSDPASQEIWFDSFDFAPSPRSSNNPPVANDDRATTNEDTTLKVDAGEGLLKNDTDPDSGDTLAVTTFTDGITTVSAGGTLQLTEGKLTVNRDGSYTFVPAANYHGNVPQITYTISDTSGETATAVLDITVVGSNDTPVVRTAIADRNNLDADSPRLDISGNFSDPDGESLTYSATGLPAGLSIDPDTGIISGTIDRSASQSGSSGLYSVTVTAKDPSGATVSDTFKWSVANPSPSATDNSRSTSEDTPVNGNLITDNDGKGVDSDPDGDPLHITQFVVDGKVYTAGKTALLKEGSLTIKSDGSYNFTPKSGYHGAMPQATYTLSDAEGGSDTAHLDIMVNASNDKPIANNDAVTLGTESSIVIDVLDNDTFGNDGAGKIAVATTPSHGSVIVDNGGTPNDPTDDTFKYTPDANYHGKDSFTYTITDTDGDTSTATVEIVIPAQNPSIALIKTGRYNDLNHNGRVDTDDTITYTFAVTNTGDVDLDDIVIDDSRIGVSGLTISGTLAPNASASVTAEYTLTQTDISSGKVENQATVTAKDPKDNSVSDLSDDNSLSENDKTVTPLATSASPLATDDYTIRITHSKGTVVNVLDNDTFGSNGPSVGSIEVVAQPAYGTVSIDDGGTPDDPTDDVVVYVPKMDIPPTSDSFTYRIKDAKGNIAEAKVGLHVECATSQDSDSGSALGMLGMLMMLFVTLMTAMRFSETERA